MKFSNYLKQIGRVLIFLLYDFSFFLIKLLNIYFIHQESSLISVMATIEFSL